MDLFDENYVIAYLFDLDFQHHFESNFDIHILDHFVHFDHSVRCVHYVVVYIYKKMKKEIHKK